MNKTEYILTPDGELYHCKHSYEGFIDLDGGVLCHWKYTRKERLPNGKWRYYYDKITDHFGDYVKAVSSKDERAAYERSQKAWDNFIIKTDRVARTKTSSSKEKSEQREKLSNYSKQGAYMLNSKIGRLKALQRAENQTLGEKANAVAKVFVEHSKEHISNAKKWLSNLFDRG